VEELAYNSATLVPSSTLASPLGEGSTRPLRVEDVLVDDNDGGRSDGSAVTPADWRRIPGGDRRIEYSRVSETMETSASR
jgi:hypothetical protein